jgi:Trypsin-co-occurring domain 2
MQIVDGGVPVAELISVVKESVRRAGVSPVSGHSDLQLSSVQLTLRVVASWSAGAGLNLRVPVIGAQLRVGTRLTRRDTHVIDMTLVPPTKRLRQVRGGAVENALVAAIATVRETMANAAGGNDPWVLADSSVDLSFVVTTSGHISLGAEAELDQEISHRLRLGLRPPAAAG